jgi:hypothetical protein
MITLKDSLQRGVNGNGIRAYLVGFALAKDIFKKMDGSFDASKLP